MCKGPEAGLCSERLRKRKEPARGGAESGEVTAAVPGPSRWPGGHPWRGARLSSSVQAVPWEGGRPGGEPGPVYTR